jgi:hypothetical protein
MSEVPPRLNGSLYIVGKPTPKWVLLSCPCGCGERIDVNLMKSRRPNWDLKIHNALVSLRPSLWMPRDRCGSHFWITQSRIEWVDDIVGFDAESRRSFQGDR